MIGLARAGAASAAIAVLLTLILPVALATDHWDVHAPIEIRSDEELFLPDVVSRYGIRGGSGTPEDPWLIARWNITARGGGLRIQDLDGHIRVEDVTFWGHPGNVAKTVHLARDAHIELVRVRFTGHTGAIDASNTTLVASELQFHGWPGAYPCLGLADATAHVDRLETEGPVCFRLALAYRSALGLANVRAEYQTEGIILHGSSLTLEDADLSHPPLAGYHNSGIYAVDSTLRIERSAVREYRDIIRLMGSTLYIRDSRVEGLIAPPTMTDKGVVVQTEPYAKGIVLEDRSTASASDIDVVGLIRGLVIEDGSTATVDRGLFIDNQHGVYMADYETGTATLTDPTFQGNKINVQAAGSNAARVENAYWTDGEFRGAVEVVGRASVPSRPFDAVELYDWPEPYTGGFLGLPGPPLALLAATLAVGAAWRRRGAR